MRESPRSTTGPRKPRKAYPFFPYKDIKRILEGKQVRFRLPVAAYVYADLGSNSERIIADFRQGKAFIEYPPDSPAGYCTTFEIPNPFKAAGDVLPVKEPCWMSYIEHMAYAQYLSDGVIVPYKHDIPPTEDTYRLFNHTYFIHAMQMPKSLIRIRLRINNTGIEYYHNQYGYEEEGFSSREEQDAAWQSRYVYRPEFQVETDPLCYFAEFTVES